jgi:hypothetical protein
MRSGSPARPWTASPSTGQCWRAGPPFCEVPLRLRAAAPLAARGGRRFRCRGARPAGRGRRLPHLSGRRRRALDGPLLARHRCTPVRHRIRIAHTVARLRWAAADGPAGCTGSPPGGGSLASARCPRDRVAGSSAGPHDGGCGMGQAFRAPSCRSSPRSSQFHQLSAILPLWQRNVACPVPATSRLVGSSPW